MPRFSHIQPFGAWLQVQTRTVVSSWAMTAWSAPVTRVSPLVRTSCSTVQPLVVDTLTTITEEPEAPIYMDSWQGWATVNGNA